MLSNQETLSYLEDAKATDAQVNVVMPDKAFVEQLQRELAGLESELSSGPTSVTSDFSALLSEKDSQIKKMKKEVKKLSLQLDLAHSQVKDLLRRVGDGGDKTALMVGDEGHNYPKLRVRSSLDDESQISVDLADSQNLDLGVGSFDASQYSDGHSRSSSAENLFQLPDSNENSLQTHSSPRLSVCIPHSVGINEYQEETEGQTDENSEYPCKEVRCIEKEEPNTNRYEESNMSGSSLNANLKTTISDSCLNRCLSSNMSDSNLNKYVDSNISSPVADTATSGVTMVENGDNVNQELQSAWLKGGEDLRGALPNFVVVSPKKPSPFPIEKDTPNLICFSLTRSRSCKASVMTGPSSLWFEKVEKQDSTSSIGFEKELTGRPEGLQLNLSALKYYAIEDSMSRSNSETSAGSAAANDLVVQDAESSSVKNYTCTCTSTTGVNETDNLQCDNKHAYTAVLEIERKPLASEKNVKDVCSDPTQDDTKSPQKWQSEFNRLQREIIELWHACNISLVHRSYFFLLFKGDPADSIYMEVELRRLNFLKEVFSRGSKTLEHGKTLTPASSMKALRHERQMLSKQIQARFSKTERENLYLKWGIGINSQNRRLQLLHRLWSDTKDMDHITESATIVAKLVGTVEPGHGFKEMFQLNFAPGRSFRSATGWKPKIKYLL